MEVKKNLSTWAMRAVQDARSSLGRALPAELRDALRSLSGSPLVSWSDVRRRMLASPSVKSLTLLPAPGALDLQIGDEADRELTVRLEVAGVSFAARGAKEVHFHVEPTLAARNAAVRECVGAVAELIARKLWPFAVERKRIGLPVPVSSDDASVLRVDLREVAAVTSFLRRQDLSLLTDIIVPSRIEFTVNGIAIALAIPNLPKP